MSAQYTQSNTDSLKNFSMDLNKFGNEIMPKAFNTFLRMIALQVLRGVIQKTPVDTGLLRGNWLVSLGLPDESEVPDSQAMVSASVTLGNGSTIIAKVDAMKQIIYIQNNLPYAEAIEDGHSQGKAPQGMLLITLEEVKAKAAASVI